MGRRGAVAAISHPQCGQTVELWEEAAKPQYAVWGVRGERLCH